MAEKQIFETVLEQHHGMDATGITVPLDMQKIFGARRVPVKVRIKGAEHRSTVVVYGGKYMMAVPKVFRAAAGIKAGDKITVEMERDTEERTVEVPQDFADALEAAGVTEKFEKMSYTHRKEYVLAVTEAKREETRARRIEKNIEMLRAKK
jgi:bifunctional DNA-binding transcriptional regulator/antitoxin component of YhaV-PrlF toxin-antitoxin module